MSRVSMRFNSYVSPFVVIWLTPTGRAFLDGDAKCPAPNPSSQAIDSTYLASRIVLVMVQASGRKGVVSRDRYVMMLKFLM